VTPFPWPDLFIIACLIVLNGVFAMSELAIVSAKTARLRAKAEQGSAAAKNRHHYWRIFGRELGRASGRAIGSDWCAR